jgi:altronate dehydratase small subunit
MVQRKQFTLFNPKDNAAIALSRLEQGSTFFIKKGEKTFKVTLKDTIPFGHKFAIEHIKKGDDVRKYGKPIGVATTEINRGEHVHIHNVVSKLLQEKG